jgi:hypothetical protein
MRWLVVGCFVVCGFGGGGWQRRRALPRGLALSVTNSTVSHNQAFYNGMTNVTIAENAATGSNGGGLWLGHTPTGTLLDCTIANNHATADGQVAGAIFGDGLTLVNTIVANNTAMYTPQCDVQRTDGSGNLQFPDNADDAAGCGSPAIGAGTGVRRPISGACRGRRRARWARSNRPESVRLAVR